VSRAGSPIRKFTAWFRDAKSARVPLPHAMVLATVSATGRPAARFVLLKRCDAQGFVFFTDERSPKGEHLEKNRRAALVFYWDRIRRQVRVEGRVESVPNHEADADWRKRPRPHRLETLSAPQSSPVKSPNELRRRVDRLGEQFPGDVPRPPFWIGYRVVPDVLEFWAQRSDRLHDRQRFERGRRGWRSSWLQP
jgi:pyridoxamine 5'-phosphate oxidase